VAAPIVLIKLSGRDQGDATDLLLRLLDAHAARVLDIGRAEIHSEASLGMLLQLAADADASTLAREVQALARDTGVAITLAEVSLGQYREWAAAQGPARPWCAHTA
jgi:phosphoserine phosphatase